jgi:hypothetical protein
MSILNFLEKSVGKWFSQRTSYQLGQTEEWHQSDKTNVFQELVPADAEDVIKLCDRAHVDPQLAIVGLQTRWEKTTLKPDLLCWCPYDRLRRTKRAMFCCGVMPIDPPSKEPIFGAVTKLWSLSPLYRRGLWRSDSGLRRKTCAYAPV